MRCRYRILSLLAAGSLVLCVATAVTWWVTRNDARGASLQVTEDFFASAVSYDDAVGFEFGVILPHWLIALLTAAIPLAWLVRRRRHHRKPAFACRRCGYDLRATPERCPECGTAATTEGAA